MPAKTSIVPWGESCHSYDASFPVRALSGHGDEGARPRPLRLPRSSRCSSNHRRSSEVCHAAELASYPSSRAILSPWQGQALAEGHVAPPQHGGADHLLRINPSHHASPSNSSSRQPKPSGRCHSYRAGAVVEQAEQSPLACRRRRGSSFLVGEDIKSPPPLPPTRPPLMRGEGR